MCYRSRHIIKAFLPEYWRTESKWVSFSCLIKIMLILLIRKKSETLFYDLKEIVRQVLGIKRSHYSRIFTWGQATLSTTSELCWTSAVRRALQLYENASDEGKDEAHDKNGGQSIFQLLFTSWRTPLFSYLLLQVRKRSPYYLLFTAVNYVKNWLKQSGIRRSKRWKIP